MSTMSTPQTTQQPVDVRGQVAIVTGASSGIGQAIAESLVQAGARVVLAARRIERLEEIARQLADGAGAGHGETLVVRCDVREPEQVQALVQQTLDRWGTVDILVANAGFGGRGPLVEGDIERWKAMIDTNVYGLLLTLKYGVPPMLARQRGQVIVMSSVAGRVATAGGAAYCGTKFAARAIGESLRIEVAAQGVRVTTIEPGVVISGFQEAAEYSPEIVKNMLKGAEPLVPADIAAAVMFALQQPKHVGIHEIMVRPRGQSYP